MERLKRRSDVVLKSDVKSQYPALAYVAMIQRCGEEQRRSTALELYEEMKARGLHVSHNNWRTLLHAFVTLRMYEVVVRVYEDMKAAGSQVTGGGR
eukprot:880582-Pyramimonas_sp.AAC.1